MTASPPLQAESWLSFFAPNLEYRAPLSAPITLSLKLFALN